MVARRQSIKGYDQYTELKTSKRGCRQKCLSYRVFQDPSSLVYSISSVRVFVGDRKQCAFLRLVGNVD